MRRKASKKSAPKKKAARSSPKAPKGAVKKIVSKKVVKKVPIKKGKKCSLPKKKKICGKACKKRIQHRGFVLAMSTILVGTSLFFTLSAGNIFSVSAYSASKLKSEAGKYLEGMEKADTPVTINYKGKDYYYVPFTVNGNLNGTFPGIMLDKDAKPVTDKTILKELFKYPGVINETASTLSGFNSAVKTKADAVTKYCQLVNKQESQLRATTASGSFVGLMYYCVKVAFDGVGLVKTGVQGLSAFMADLAKGQIQDEIVSYFTGADSRAALDSAYKAYEAAKKTSRYCAEARNAWQAMKTTSGSITPENANNAIYSLAMMFSFEKDTISNLRAALQKINNYPRIITKIGASDYKNGIAGLDDLIKQLSDEKKYWDQEYQDATTFLDMWANLQIARVQGAAPADCHGTAKKGSYSYCSSKCPCDAGQGDCDSDKECKSGLKCVNNVGKKYGWSSDVDVCEKPAAAPAPITSPSCHKEPLGGWSYCTKDCPCATGEGDCDLDSQCKSGLKCVQNNGKKFGYAADLDFCEGVATAPAPTAPADCHKGKNGNFSYCTSSCPCDKGQGD
ncbi:hypothetical protein KJ885_05375, partial [Patescibacteria group bacterium]|nr:hypothetical protein [Patescibacteria group bacterium]